MTAKSDLPILRTAFREDVPRAFRYSHTNTSPEYHLCGPYAQTIWNFAKYYKLRLELDFINSDNMSIIYERLETGVYNISLNGARFTNHKENYQYTYPLYWVRNCIMVPLEDELPKYLYVVWPFDRYIWLTLLFGAIYIAVLMQYIEYPTHSATRSITRNLLHSVAILLYCSNMNLSVRGSSAPLRVLIFYGLVIVLAFILSVYYAPYLTAYDLKPVFAVPKNHIEDLLQANIKVLIAADRVEELHGLNVAEVVRLKPLLEGIPRSQFQAKFEKMDRTYAYALTADQFNFLNRQQRYLKKPYFHFSNICFGTVFRAFPVQMNAAFLSTLNSFILKVQESGLWVQWEERAFQSAVKAGYAKVHLDTYPVEPLNLKFFTLAWIVLATGISVSCCSLLLEVYLDKRKNSRLHQRLVIA